MDFRINVNINAGASRKVTQPSQFGEIVTVQVENISNRHKLSEILRSYVTEFKSIVGIVRVADYNHKLLDSVVFLQFHDRKEAQLMLDIQSQFILGQLVIYSNPHVVQGRVPFKFNYDSEEEAPANGIPIPMALFNLNTKAESNSTIHLIKVLESFEFSSKITSCRFAFDHKRHIIRNFANLTFLNRRDALNAQQTEHWIIGNKLEVKVPKSFPVLLHNALAGLLTNGTAEFSSMVRDNNFYHANIADPTRQKYPVPTTMDVNQCPDIADIPLPPEPLVQPNSRQVLDEAFAIANVGQEIDRLNSNYFINTPPQSPVLSIGGNEDFEELDKEISSSKRRRLN